MDRTMSATVPSIDIQAEPFDTAAEIARIGAELGGRAGAVVTFTGSSGSPRRPWRAGRSRPCG
jgi:molybdopterin synthase catalytic subunit